MGGRAGAVVRAGTARRRHHGGRDARLAENELGARPPHAPVFLFHGGLDEIIPLSQAQTLRREYCAAGVAVTWGTYAGEHVTTLAFSAGDVVNYLGDRFAGKPARSNC